jgi:DNA gyrase/topoisomerase IV subunit A
MGKVFKLPISKIPFSDKRSSGIDIRLLLKNCTSNINFVIYEPTLAEFNRQINKYYLVTLTRAGFIKKMDLEDFFSANTSGLVYAKLDDGDYIKDVMVIRHGVDVVVYSKNKAIRLSMDAVPYLKRATKGNKTLPEEADGVSIIKDDTTDIIVVTKRGHINRFSVVALERSDRSGRAKKVIKLNKGDEIVAVYGLNVDDTLLVNTTSAQLSFPVNTIPAGSSVGVGTKLIQSRDSIVSCSFIYKSL